MELPNHLTAKAVREAREGSSHMDASSLGATELLGEGMTSISCSKSLKAFRDFAELISAKLGMSEITNN